MLVRRVEAARNVAACHPFLRTTMISLVADVGVSSTTTLPAVGSLSSGQQVRCFSDQKNPPSFRPRRPMNRNYRPLNITPKKKKDWAPGNPHKFVEIGKVKNPKNELEADFGPLAAEVIRVFRKEKEKEKEKQRLECNEDPIEEQLRWADYLTAEVGSIEDLVGDRRTMAEASQSALYDEDLEDYENQLDMIRHFETEDLPQKKPSPLEMERLELEKKLAQLDDSNERKYSMEEEPETRMDPNQKVYGEWSEYLVTVNRTTKLWRGGRLESYRALVVGGNLNGCGAFAIGKALDPSLAVEVASRLCKKNIYFVDRYQNDGLTRDLAGKQNSCKVHIRSTDNGLRGNFLMREILKRFGITNAACKSYGNRSPYNVVRATFKALMTHEGIEDIALKRGKRILSVDRAMRMRI
jgi:small subunit ribosomal protein S5